ncbi:GSTT1-like protein [Mya arenaria]|uniref:GSTT1-like protein n=1 Tax=Mya arenaria TaxID=6604 RepID=A0ABY7DVA3_MYAAR|nr:glutathione S-transferase theta-1-like [Mya arenaria]XP_052799756.1 glutathione S-transferase theta-1-like [Mya arenaria]WAR01380.1 GSTT1-like protein [Mya arenaria]
MVEFYYDLLSQPCRAVYLFLKAAGIDFTPKVTSLIKRDHYEPEFTKKNPYHKIPLIDDDGFILAESVAIMRYLAMKNNVADSWLPQNDVKQMARVDEFLNWQHLCVRKPCVDLFLGTFRSRVGVGKFTKEPLDEEKAKTFREEVKKCVTHIGEHYLKDRPFIAGDEISVADILAVCELGQLTGIGAESLYMENETVSAWFERVKAKLQPHYDDSMATLLGLKKMFDEAKA